MGAYFVVEEVVHERRFDAHLGEFHVMLMIFFVKTPCTVLGGGSWWWLQQPCMNNNTLRWNPTQKWKLFEELETTKQKKHSKNLINPFIPTGTYCPKNFKKFLRKYEANWKYGNVFQRYFLMRWTRFRHDFSTIAHSTLQKYTLFRLVCTQLDF